MLLIFRLNKDNGTQASFILPKTLDFSRMTFKGFTWERCDNLAGDINGVAPATNSDLPVFLHCDFLDDNEVCFLQGRNTTIIANMAGLDVGVGNMIPLGGIKEAREAPFRQMDLKVIDRASSYEASKVLLVGLYQIQLGVAELLTPAQAFGAVENDVALDALAEPPTAPSPYDHGVNLYFELDCDETHDFTQSYTALDST